MTRNTHRILMIGGAVLVSLGLVSLMPPIRTKQKLERLNQVLSNSPTTDSIDWDYLRNTNDNVLAWLSVDGTTINTPVVYNPSEDPDYYLTHDFWKTPSITGCPFLADNCQANEGIQIVFAHHINWSREAFSELFDCWQIERFFSLGDCHWTTPEKQHIKLSPLCSLLTNCWDSEIQVSAYDSQAELELALRRIVERSSAHVPNWQELCASAKRVVILITCASMIPGQEERSCVVFVSCHSA